MQKIEYDLPVFENEDKADLNDYSQKVAEAIKKQIDKFGQPLTFKGTVDTMTDLQNIQTKTNGDIYEVKDIEQLYIYNGNEWVIYSDTLKIKIEGFDVIKVETLPTENIQEKTIYLVPNTETKENNVYDEYIYVNSTWEIIGSTAVDLSNYYNKEEVDNKVDNIQALPTGGTTGQVLTKQSDTDGDVSWEDSAGGDSLPVGTIIDYDGDTVPDGYEEVEDTLEQALQNKVDKVEGKTLSTNDFTNEYKNKLDGIEANADKLLYVLGAGVAAAGETVRFAVKLPCLGILGVRVWKSLVETFKLYACVGSNGYACTVTQLVEHNYNSACKIEITRENAVVYVSITNTSSEAQYYRVVQINGYK